MLKLKICNEILHNPYLNVFQRIDIIIMILSFSLSINLYENDKGSFDIRLSFNKLNPISYILILNNFLITIILNIVVLTSVSLFILIKGWFNVVSHNVKRINGLIDNNVPYIGIDNFEIDGGNYD